MTCSKRAYLQSMELVLKVPKGKPPFMGIDYGTEWQGNKINEDLFLNHSQQEYKLVIEYVKKQLTIRLICESLITVRFYTPVEFSPEKLKDWLYIIRKNTTINFGHVYTEGNTHLPVRSFPDKKVFVLKVVNIEIVSSETGHRESAIRLSGNSSSF